METRKALPRVGVVAGLQGFGGIQTCVTQLLCALNRLGIVPDLLWDRPPDVRTLGEVGAETRYRACRFAIPRKVTDACPPQIGVRMRRLSLLNSRLPLGDYDLVYNFESVLRMDGAGRSVTTTPGPPLISQLDRSHTLRPGSDGSSLSDRIWRLSMPRVRPDGGATYVTFANWIARLFDDEYGFTPRVVWPPAHERPYQSEAPQAARRGFLFFSRIVPLKRPEIMLDLARAFPAVPVTLAGAAARSVELALVRRLQTQAQMEGLDNVEFVVNPQAGEIGRLFALRDAFVFPAEWEHFGIVTVEAIRGGLVPIVHDSGGQREIVPYPELRFSAAKGLLDAAERVLGFSAGYRASLVDALGAHVQPASPEHYGRVMTSLGGDVLPAAGSQR